MMMLCVWVSRGLDDRQADAHDTGASPNDANDGACYASGCVRWLEKSR